MHQPQNSRIDIIQRPPKIYLDTNHLINIANVRKGLEPQTGRSGEGYRRIDECIKSYCALIFNPYAALEWVEGNATIESAWEIAAIVDSVKFKYMLEADYIVFTLEILDQCRKQYPNIRVPDLPPILQNISEDNTFYSLRGILVNQVPDYLEDNELGYLEKKEGTPTKIERGSARQWVEETLNWRLGNPGKYQERVDGFKASLSEDIARKDEYFHDRERYRRDWIKRLLKIDKILRALNPGIDVDALLGKIDIEGCQAIILYWTVRERRMRSGNQPQDNDVDDYLFLPVVPYADIILTENNLREFILQADRSLESKVFSKVGDALNALENQGFAW